MSLQNLYFDCETAPDYARSDLWERGVVYPDLPNATDEERAFANAQAKTRHMSRMALQPEACQLVGLNVCIGSGEPKSGWVGETNKATGLPYTYTEADLLTLFWTWAAAAPRLIGFNCLRFDIPVILTRSAILGVAPTKEFFDIKPWQDGVIDLAAKRFGHSRDWMSLKALRRMLELPVPEKYAEVADNTGADVEELYLSFLAGGGNDDESLAKLKLYGELDAWTTRALAQVWSGYFFGRIE